MFLSTGYNAYGIRTRDTAVKGLCLNRLAVFWLLVHNLTELTYSTVINALSHMLTLLHAYGHPYYYCQTSRANP